MSRANGQSVAIARDELLRLIQDDYLAVRVIPNARENRLFLDEEKGLGARVSVSPEDGKVNAATIKLLAKALGLPMSNLAIVRGQKSRNKLIAVTRQDH